ncbi:radical SAM family heme chaperone HemW [Clostridium kluyveri]|uniref:radical SAM family heme chaperone HemW n=1 Tax=Clostridium kluyveri TaxID=1534 RepID=UPI002247453A|nr:radical SAM family heme chaperone HemW [Clostridium kluyveri]UZQ51711.1 radical SAM family heme chaperone HemW [Clostridium kluyveri]
MYDNEEVNYSNPLSLYIHIPFCKKKCFYCDFPSYSGKENLMMDYSKVLAKDIETIGNREINTIFIGGGTPTYLSLDAWYNIYKSIQKLNTTENLEFTVEGNPGTFTKEKLIFLRNMGVNRLSIGLQAWQNNMLKNLGRVHTLEDFLEGYKMARSLGFSNINVDLIFGLPGQTLEIWRDCLENVVGISPEHISCYSLIVEKDTPFYNLYGENKLNLPSEEEERAMYDFTLEFLLKKCYKQYEISNFCKKGNMCRHNLIYWDLNQYIGCGAGAHSYVGGYRYRNTENIEQYILEGNRGNFLKLDRHKNSIYNDMEEFMFMGLRKVNGISISDFNNRFSKNIYSVYGNIITKYINNKMLILRDDRLYLSRRGIEVSNSIMCEFIFN